MLAAAVVPVVVTMTRRTVVLATPVPLSLPVACAFSFLVIRLVFRVFPVSAVFPLGMASISMRFMFMRPATTLALAITVVVAVPLGVTVAVSVTMFLVAFLAVAVSFSLAFPLRFTFLDGLLPPTTGCRAAVFRGLTLALS